MRYAQWFVSTLLLLVTYPTMSWADDFVQFDGGIVSTCPAKVITEKPPSVDSSCKIVPALEVDPYKQLIWVLGTITPSERLRQSHKPIGLALSAKAASRVFLNGKMLAENGIPGKDEQSELPGRIDAVFYITREQLQPGSNQIAVLMSGQHNLIQSARPLLTFGIFDYVEPPYHETDDAWLAFLTFGMFAISGLYTGLLSRLSATNAAPLSLSAASFMAAGQVMAETLRSIWNYPYPIHDVRLGLIILCGLGVGLTLSLHALQQLKVPKPRLILAGIGLVTLMGIQWSKGFDTKASMSILIPSLLSCVIAIYYAFLRRSAAVFFTIFFVIFAGLNLFDPGEFLDVNYFLLLAVLVMSLTVFQAIAFRDVVREREDMAERRRQLEVALDRVNDTRPKHVMVRHSGKIEKINYDEIISLSAAGDYTVLTLSDGREVLHTASLAKMEKLLPRHFLRVHRSHTVNADCIVSLTRLSGGTGKLELSNGATTPVSRRIMPSVREVLSGGKKDALTSTEKA